MAERMSKKEFNSLRAYAENLEEVIKEIQSENIRIKQSLDEIDALKSKIEFYKGQIEAYQYCMNCRRL